mgnify:CR=1 FL=1
MEREASARLVAGALLVGASLLSGNAALISAAGGVGVNWASEPLGELWRLALPPAGPGGALAELRAAIGYEAGDYDQVGKEAAA